MGLVGQNGSENSHNDASPLSDSKHELLLNKLKDNAEIVCKFSKKSRTE